MSEHGVCVFVFVCQYCITWRQLSTPEIHRIQTRDQMHHSYTMTYNLGLITCIHTDITVCIWFPIKVHVPDKKTRTHSGCGFWNR